MNDHQSEAAGSGGRFEDVDDIEAMAAMQLQSRALGAARRSGIMVSPSHIHSYGVPKELQHPSMLQLGASASAISSLVLPLQALSIRGHQPPLDASAFGSTSEAIVSMPGYNPQFSLGMTAGYQPTGHVAMNGASAAAVSFMQTQTVAPTPVTTVDGVYPVVFPPGSGSSDSD